VSGTLPNTLREDKGFFAEKQANRGKSFCYLNEITR